MPEQQPKDILGTVCPRCAHQNRPGILFCEDCGYQLVTELKPTGEGAVRQPVPAAVLSRLMAIEENDTETVDVHNIQSGFRPNTPIFEKNMVLRLEFKLSGEHLLVRLEGNKPLVMGRKDPDETFKPDVDLMPFGAYKSGISRRHAELALSGRRLFLRDLGSSNGTYMNGIRLAADEAHQLRDNDQIKLGTLVMVVGFQAVMEA
ncbi:MAG: FHA domain-containing protein [Anaerolineae bacterium]